MATIVVHKRSGRRYILIGTGYGAYKSQMPSVFGGSLFPHEEEGEIPLAAVSDREGNIKWILSEELVVTEVDGQPVHLLLEQEYEPLSELQEAEDDASEEDSSVSAVRKTQKYELCPGCGHRVVSDVKECPSCGLVLIVDEDG